MSQNETGSVQWSHIMCVYISEQNLLLLLLQFIIIVISTLHPLNY